MIPDRSQRYLFAILAILIPHLGQAKLPTVAVYALSLDSEGRLSDVTLESDLNPAIDAYLSNWLTSIPFEPATLDGEQVESTTSIWIEFSLQESDAGAVLKVEKYEVGPRLRRGEQPQYPRALLSTPGSVTLEFTVRKSGRVTDIEVVYASHELFAEAAEKAVRSWRYYPDTAAGQPIEVRARKTIDFLPYAFDADSPSQ